MVEIVIKEEIEKGKMDELLDFLKSWSIASELISIKTFHKKPKFSSIHVDIKDFKFDREEANER